MSTTKKCCSLGAAFAVLATASWSSAQTRQIPISEYLALHDYVGYFEGYFNPATPDTWVYLDIVGGRMASFGDDVGTTLAGSVTIRPLQDGRAHVTVLIHMNNIEVWGYQGTTHVFGSTPRQVALNGYPPSLGNGIVRHEFTMASVDTPLPPLWMIDSPDYPRESFFIEVHGAGEFRAASGYPEGTPGIAQVVQRNLPTTGVPSGCPVDCWPVELAFYKPTGK